MGFPRTSKGSDSIWVIMDILTKLTQFVSIKITYPLQKLAEIYICEIVRLHGIPSSIVSDRDMRFICRFWESFQKAI